VECPRSCRFECCLNDFPHKYSASYGSVTASQSRCAELMLIIEQQSHIIDEQTTYSGYPPRAAHTDDVDHQRHAGRSADPPSRVPRPAPTAVTGGGSCRPMADTRQSQLPPTTAPLHDRTLSVIRPANR